MYRTKYTRVRLGGTVDIKSKFEKFERLSKTDQNDNVLNQGKDKISSYRAKKDITEVKKSDTAVSLKKETTELKRTDLAPTDRSICTNSRITGSRESEKSKLLGTRKDLEETKGKEAVGARRRDAEGKEESSQQPKTTNQEGNMDKASKKFEGLKLRDTASPKDGPSGARAKPGTSTFAARKAEERRKNDEATKKMKSIEQRMQERKQQKIADQKKKAQGRAAFKQQLEANAPKRDSSKKDAIARAETNIDKLLKWVQTRINVYPGVHVEDWTTSWSDGKAFCALVQSLEPDNFPVNDVDHSGQDRRKNFKLAFDYANEVGVPPLLDADDMASLPVPDRRSVITYVHTIYKVMVHEKREKEREKKEGEKTKDSDGSSSEEEKESGED